MTPNPATNAVKAQILAVDDTPDNLRLLTEILSREGYQVRVATSGPLALKSVDAEPPDLILLDIKMPVMDGYEVCRRLKAHDKGRGIPVIFISALDDAGGKVAGFDAGGVDYVTKPFEAVEVLARVSRHLDLRRLQKQLETRNAQLQKEIAGRARVEDELREHKEHLEERVAERTEQLARTNEELQREIADRKRAEIALRESEEQFRSLVAEIPGITYRCAFDRDWTVLYVSPGVHRIGGYRAEDFVGRPFREFAAAIYQGESDSVVEKMRNATEAGVPWEIEYRIHRRDGGVRWVCERGRAVKDETGAVCYLDGFIHDITERHELIERLGANNRELERARADAERANMAKTMFLANMSHELRTPMNSILGFTDRLVKKQLAEPMRERDLMAVEIVDRNAKHLIELINSILDISKIEAGRTDLTPSPFDLRDAVRNVVSQAGGLPDAHGLAVSAELPDVPMMVQADRVKIVQVLTNLVANAMRYTEKGAVTVTAARGEDESLGPVLRVVVRDTGIGIRREDIGRLFTAFTQLDMATPRRVGGTGLGLVIARQYAGMHGGRIDVQSTFGEGSEFTLVLPWQPPALPIMLDSPANPTADAAQELAS